MTTREVADETEKEPVATKEIRTNAEVTKEMGKEGGKESGKDGLDRKVYLAIAASLERVSAAVAANLGGTMHSAAIGDAIGAAKRSLVDKTLPVFADGTPSADAACWPALRLCLHATQPARIREAALDAVQKLVAHKTLRGSTRLSVFYSHHNSNSNTVSFNHNNNNVVSSEFTPTSTTASTTASTPTTAATSSLGLLFNYAFRSGSVSVPAAETGNDLSAIDVSSPRSSTPTASLDANSSALLQVQVQQQQNHQQQQQQQFLIDEIIHSVCVCFSLSHSSSILDSSGESSLSASPDASVQTHVLKVLLTAVTSTSTCQVHSASLLKAVQTCCNIYLAAGSSKGSNSVLAKAALTQIVHAVFSRMERYARVVKKSGVLNNNSNSYENDKLENEDSNSVELNGIATVSTNYRFPPANTIKPLQAPKRIVGMLEDDDLLSNSTSTVESGGDRGENNPNTLPKQSSSPGSTKQVVTAYDPAIAYYNTLLKKDAFLVLRLLCRLSTQTDSGLSSLASTFNPASISAAASSSSSSFSFSHTDDAVALNTIRARALALEMILSILSNAGHVLQTEDMYADLVKTTLAASVSRNAITTNIGLFEFSLSIFLLVLRYYRARMKSEVEVLLNTIYLHIVETPHSPAQQKLMVLQSLRKICADPQTIVDTYLNHDCDMHCVSLYERILTVSTRVAQHSGHDSTGLISLSSSSAAASASLSLMAFAGFDSRASAAAETRTLEAKARMEAVRCLVALVRSLVSWSRVEEAVGVRLTIASVNVNAIGESNSKLDGSDNSGEYEIWLAHDVSSVASPQRSQQTAETLLMDALLASSDDRVVLNTRLQDVSIAQKKGSLATAQQQSGSAVVGVSGSGISGAVARSPVRTPTVTNEPANQSQDNAVAAAEERAAIALIAQRKALLKQAVRLFAEKPIKGISFFKAHGFISKQTRAVGHNNNTETSLEVSDEDDEAYSIAMFLRNTPGLDKTAIGSYLGEGGAFYIKVMHMFVDTLDFDGVGFVDALRAFLQTFRLPGEAQKIDRLMEKFADRYCENNPDIFAKADTAYTLAFSVIMLNTDLHSAHIKDRMDKEAFLKNNRGINDNANLPDEYLEGIFDEILANEIVMEDEQTGKFAKMVQGWGVNELSDKERMDLYRLEIAQIQKKSQQLMSSAANGSNEMTPFKIAVQPEIAKPMFATACWPLIAAFSQLFESAVDDITDDLVDDATAKKSGNDDELNLVDLCLEGFAGGIKIASVFKMEMEREAFVTSLSKLTGLSHFRDFKRKNIKAIRTLLGLTLSYAEHLDSSWFHIIKIVSQMERLQLLGAAARGASLDSTRQQQEDLTKLINPNVEKFLSEFTSQDTVVAVDRIFTSSTAMSGPSILQFFKAVCHASLEEVGIDPISIVRAAQMQALSPTGDGAPVLLPTPHQSPTHTTDNNTKVPVGVVVTTKTDGPPRMFLLQKIVEIAHYNMHRIRFEWTQIWRILQPHFVVVACHPNATVASFAVDALRQLSMKFLEKEELVHFSTQNEFLKSFERIMKLTTDDSIRHMILSSLTQMISARAGSIRSGWKPIFVVLSRPTIMTSGTNEFDELLIESFQLVQTIFKDYFSIVLHAGGLVEFINCIADFALIDAVLPAHDEIVLTSIQLLQLSANQMVQNVEDEILQIKLKTADLKEIVVVVLVSPQPSKLVIQTSSGQIKSAIQLHLLFSGIISEENFFLKWFPIFSAFSRVSMGSNNPSVRTKCIESLFEVLSQCIQFFDLKCIRAIYRTAILPIFDDLREQFDKFESDDNISQSEESISKQGSVTIWILGLRLTIDLFSDNFIKIAADPETISSILHIALSMMQRRDQTLVATGQICLHQFIQQNCSKFSESNSWSTIVDSIEQAFRITNPFELATCDYSSMKILPEPPASMTFNTAALGTIQTNAPEVLASVIAEGTATAKMYGAFVSLESLDFNQTILKCSVHIELLQSIRDALLLPFRDGKLVITTIPADLRIRLLNCIRDSYTVARCFNANYHLRYSIWKKRLVQQLPNLIKQETISIAAHVKILFAIYRAEGDADELAAGVLTQEEIGWVEKNVKMLVVETLDIMERYVMMLGDAAQVNATNIGLWSPVVVLVFRELLAMDCWWRSLPKISGEIEVNEEERIEVVRSQRQAVKCLVLKKQLPRLFRLAIRMMGVDRTDVRQALQEFIEKVGEELFVGML